MKSVLAIAAIAVRNAVRSRVVLVLLGLLGLAMVGLPMTIRGDGTLAGQVQILLDYTLGAVRVILSVATVWAGCAAVSQEIQGRQIQLVLTKPVHRVQIWLGKWLGLLAMDAVLLAVCGGVIYGALRWTVRPGRVTAAQEQSLREEILVARRQVLAEPVDVESATRQVMEERRGSGELPEGLPPDQLYQIIRQGLLAQAYTVPTGYKRQWIFNLPAGRSAGRPLLIRYEFGASQPGEVTVNGLWLVGPADRAERYEVRQSSVAGKTRTFTVPVSVAGGSRRLAVEYANVNPVPVATVFSPVDGVQLLVHEGGFEANFGRSLLVVFWQLAFLGALAVTAGALLSMPVAALVTGYLVLLMQVGDSLRGLAAEAAPFTPATGEPAPVGAVLDWVLQWVLRLESALVQPLLGPNPLEWVATGRLIDWWWVGSAFLIKVIGYCGVLALAGAWLFNRREIGLGE